MSFEVLTYIFYLLVNSLIILLDILVIFAVVKSGELSRNFTFHTIITAIAMDIVVYIITIIHDVPSYALERDFSTVETKQVFVLLLCLQWFAQLLFLPLLSIIHLIAIFSPARFRRASHKLFTSANIAVVILSLLIPAKQTNNVPSSCSIKSEYKEILGYTYLAPLYTKYCGYTYLIPGHYWYFDHSMPYTYLFERLNQSIQIICVVFVFTADIVIIWSIFRLRSRTLLAQFDNGISKKIWKFGKEARFATNFLLLSTSFLVMTICYNVDFGYGIWQTLLFKIFTLLNIAKWPIYVLGNASVFNAVRGIFCHNSQLVSVTSSTVIKF